MGRIYTIGDLKLPSVTTVLADYDKAGLMIWVDIVAKNGYELPNGDITHDYREVMRETSKLGTKIHKELEGYVKARIKGESYLAKEECIPYIEALKKWIKDKNVLLLACEMTVHSKKYRYAGTLDLLCMIDGKVYVVDFKVTTGHFLTNSIQVTAYAKAVEEEENAKWNGGNPLQVEGTGVLRIGKGDEIGTYDWKDYTKRMDAHWECFKGLLTAWYTYKNRRGVSNGTV